MKALRKSSAAASTALKVISKAGKARLLVSFVYNGKLRTCEPYSLRGKQTGNVLFYGWEQESQSIKCFKLQGISQAAVTRTQFHPQFTVEFS